MYKETEYRGKVYPSISAIHASAVPKPVCSKDAFVNRVSKGWTIEKALYTPISEGAHFKKHVLVYKGKTYPSAMACYHDLKPKMSESVFYRLVQRGVKVEDILNHKCGPHRNVDRQHLVTYKGETHCIRDWEDKFGFKHGTIGNRLRSGWDIADALTRPLHLGQHDATTSPCTTQSYKLGGNRRLVYMRMHRLGWTREQAMSVPVMDPRESGRMSKPHTIKRELRSLGLFI